MLNSFIQILANVITVISPIVKVNGKKEFSAPKFLALIVTISAIGAIVESLFLMSTTTAPTSMAVPSTETTVASTPTESTYTTQPTVTETTETAAVEFVPAVAAGDVCTIGTYAGKPIDWKVLDVQDNKALLLSTKALECIKYHAEDGTVTWGSCSLRNWLNGTFLEAAFSKSEQAAIVTTAVDNGTAQGNPAWANTGSGQTKDKIFLLSYAEFKRYVDGRDFSICEAAYSTKPGEDTRVQLLDNGTEAAFWWLRSPGENGKQAAFINFEGKCYSNYATNWYLSARPAMWIDLKKFDNL